MTANELYEALDKLGVEWDFRESFEGLRVINFEVEEVTEDEEENNND